MHATAQPFLQLPVAAEDLVSVIASLDGNVMDPGLSMEPPGAATTWIWPPRRALLALLITTRTAFTVSVGEAVGQWGRRRSFWSDDFVPNVATAVTEAVINAIVHGNLGLPGMDAFDRLADDYFAAVARALIKDERGLWPVGITIRRAGTMVIVHVDDAGAGYVPRQQPPIGSVGSFAGRGSALIRAFSRRVRISRGGRRISMGFVP